MPFQTGPSPATSWTVHADHVSLLRAPVAPRPLHVAAQPAALELDLARTALVIVDMQNDFCHGEGWFGCRGIDVSPMRKPIDGIRTLTAALRPALARVVWLNWGIRADRANLPPGVLYRGKRAADALVHKHRLSGFQDTELDSLLRQSGVTTLLFAGINTDRCVFSTLQDAGFLGYDCVLLEDVCNTPSPQYVTDAIHFLVRQLHGFTATAADFVSAIQK